MADLSITASQVQPPSSEALIYRGTAGEQITPGETVYIDTNDGNKLKLAQCDGTALQATLKGIALHQAESGQPLAAQFDGDVTLGAGASMTVGEIYVLSETAGGIAPEGDITTSDDYVVVIGVAISASVLRMKTNNSGAQIP